MRVRKQNIWIGAWISRAKTFLCEHETITNECNGL